MGKNKFFVIGTGLFAEEIADIISFFPDLEIEAFVEGINKNFQ